jgi:hypothetical protein
LVAPALNTDKLRVNTFRRQTISPISATNYFYSTDVVLIFLTKRRRMFGPPESSQKPHVPFAKPYLRFGYTSAGHLAAGSHIRPLPGGLYRRLGRVVIVYYSSRAGRF